MPIFERISRWMANLRHVEGSVTDADLGIAVKAPTFGVSVSNQGAMNITAMYAGIRIRSENIASFPKMVKVHTPEGLVDASEHPVFAVINERPNAYTNKFDFWNVINTWLDGWGNSYAFIEWGPGGIPLALHQIHPNECRPFLYNGRKWYDVHVADPQRAFLNGVHQDYKMLHFMLVTLNGIKGENPIIRNAMALGKSLATEKFASEFYTKGGNIRAVLEAEGHMSDDEFLAFSKHFQQSSQNFDTPILEYGMKYKQLDVNPVAAQLIQSETLSIQDVARILNIPPHMLGELSHATYSNIEHQTMQFVQYSLRPTVKRLEDELESKMFLGKEKDMYTVKFNLDGLLRGDTEARSKYYHNAILDGYMSRNEVRRLEGLPHAEGLDDFLYPLNTGVVGQDPQDNNEE